MTTYIFFFKDEEPKKVDTLSWKLVQYKATALDVYTTFDPSKILGIYPGDIIK